MDKKVFRLCSVMALLVLVMFMVGCQKYETAEFKAPVGEENSAVEIDVTDLEDTEAPEAEDEPAVNVRYPTPDLQPAAAVKSVSKYRPLLDEEGAPAAEEEGYAAVGDEYKKAAYVPVVEEEGLPMITVTEGDLVKLNVRATDADGDVLTYQYTAPLNGEGKWQTRAGDAGVFYSTITVSDGKTETVKKVKIVVEPKNNKPVLEFIPDISVREGETVTISPKASDSDGQRLTYKYSGWMTSNIKQVGYNEEGRHTVTVSVTDGISTVSQDVTVTVQDVNRPPEVEIEF